MTNGFFIKTTAAIMSSAGLYYLLTHINSKLQFLLFITVFMGVCLAAASTLFIPDQDTGEADKPIKQNV